MRDSAKESVSAKRGSPCCEAATWGAMTKPVTVISLPSYAGPLDDNSRSVE